MNNNHSGCCYFLPNGSPLNVFGKEKLDASKRLPCWKALTYHNIIFQVIACTYTGQTVLLFNVSTIKLYYIELMFEPNIKASKKHTVTCNNNNNNNTNIL